VLTGRGRGAGSSARRRSIISLYCSLVTYAQGIADMNHDIDENTAMY
jgi:hypothetical protein